MSNLIEMPPRKSEEGPPVKRAKCPFCGVCPIQYHVVPVSDPEQTMLVMEISCQACDTLLPVVAVPNPGPRRIIA